MVEPQQEQQDPQPAPGGGEPSCAPIQSCAACLILVLLALLGTFLRTSLATRDPGFDLQAPTGLFKSDPGLLYYLTERVDAAGGFLPDDFGADPRLVHPDLVDVPATYTIGQEFLVAWAHRLIAPSAPLHVVCHWVSSITASCVVFGIFLLGLALTGRRRWGLLSAALYVLTPAAYRTIGFLCIREDLSIPLYALHIGSLALALRFGGFKWALLSGLAAATAWAGWLAIGLVLGIESLVLALAFLVAGRAALNQRAAWALFLPLLLASLLVPALRSRGLWLSIPTIAGCALLVANLQFSRGRLRAVGAFVVVSLLGGALRFWLGGDDMSHVVELALAKLRHLGQLPSDPAALSFESRMLWQGPFASLGIEAILSGLGLLLPAAALALLRGPKVGGAGGLRALLPLAFLTALLLASQVARLLAIPAMFACALVASLLVPALNSKRGTSRQPVLLAIGLLALQAVFFTVWSRSLQLGWYRPLLRQHELVELKAAIPEHVPEGEAVLADFMNSSAILAHTGRPMVLQAKWETKAARTRVELFWHVFYNGTPEQLRALCKEVFDCEWLLVDRFTLGILHISRSLAGLGPREAFCAGSPAESMLSRDADVLSSVPGFELVWRSPDSLRQSNGAPSDFYRLYRVAD